MAITASISGLLGSQIGDAAMAASLHLCLALVAACLGLICGSQVLACLPGISGSDESADIRYLRINVGGDISLALANSRREVLHVSEKARAMLEQVWRSWKNGDCSGAKSAARIDDQIDLLDREIKRHLAEGSGDHDPASENERLSQMCYVSRLEAVGDIIEKQLASLASKGIRRASAMPAESRRQLDAACQTVLNSLLTAETAFATRDLALVQRLRDAKVEFARFWKAERDGSLMRRRAGVSHETETVYLDMLACLEHINRCACAAASDIERGLDAPERSALPSVA